MKFRRVQLLSVALLIAVTLSACGRASPPKITREMGYPILPYGVFIDVENNPKVDKMFENYRVLTVSVTNRSLQPFRLDIAKDVWRIKDKKGKWNDAINSLRVEKPEDWNRLPEKMQGMIDYPEIVPASYTQTFDIFLPKQFDIKDYKMIRYYNYIYNQTIELLPPP